MLRFAELNLYPLKGAQAVKERLVVHDDSGLRCDREYVLVDQTGAFLSQRSTPAMASLALQYNKEDLTVKASDGTSIVLAERFWNTAALQPTKIDIWDKVGGAYDTGDTTAHWFSRVLGKSCRLLWANPKARRRANPRKAGGDVRLNFQDGSPVHLIGTASVKAIAEAAGYPTDDASVLKFARRFRANLVVKTAEPFEEDRWTTFSTNEITFRMAWPCERCEVPNRDQETGTIDKSVTKALAKLRRLSELVKSGQLEEAWLDMIDASKPIFGWNLVSAGGGNIGRIMINDDIFVTP